VAAGWALAAAAVAVIGPRCAVAAVLHVPCPTCGMTRALGLLATGRVAASLRLHPLAAPAALAMAMLAAATVRAAWNGEGFSDLRRAGVGRAAIGLALGVYAAVVALWIARAAGALGGPVPIGLVWGEFYSPQAPQRRISVTLAHDRRRAAVTRGAADRRCGLRE
jgi:hypothetical protein